MKSRRSSATPNRSTAASNSKTTAASSTRRKPASPAADSFEYTIADAVHLYKTDLPSVGNFEGVQLPGGSFGSSLAPVPGHPNEFFGLEDRGPNVESPLTTPTQTIDVLPKPSYDPSIARFSFEDGEAELVETIPLRDSSGHPFSGLVNSLAPTGETIETLKGVTLAKDPDGYDPEGLVAMPDGSFWVSDEYGPFVTHFTSQGKELARLSPFKTVPKRCRPS